jgi:REP element-mobilizing transposase RayT
VTDPRRLLPGASYLVTRRCTRREFLLKPSPAVNHLFKYVLAVSAARYGILIHAACVMSNHFHLIVTDPQANLPDFTHLLDGILAKVLNTFYCRRENLWAPSSYSAVELIAPADLVEKVAYTLANPAAAGLVEHGREWPGVWSHPRSIGQPGETIERPDRFFSKKSTLPPTVVLTFSLPPGFDSVDAFRAQVMSRADDRERAAAAERAGDGSGVLGARRVLEQRHTGRPAAPRRSQALNPKIAAKEPGMRREALARLLGFLRSHRDALLRYCRGERNVTFPHGTYLMRVRFGAACASG